MRVILFPIVLFALFWGAVGMAGDSNDFEKELLDIKKIISDGSDDDCSRLAEVANLDIPVDICRALKASHEVNEFSDSIFLGYEFVSYDVLIESYASKNGNGSVFQYLGVNESLDLSPEYRFYFSESSEGFIDEPEDVVSLRKMIPILQFDGDFLFFHDSDDKLYRGLVSIIDGQASVVAPTLSEHIEDLLSGFGEGAYKADGEQLIFPSSWHYRKKLRSGLVEMDESGEINNSPDDSKPNDKDDDQPGFLKKWLDNWK